MASFDKAIPPGGEGSITLRVRTKGRTGPLRKSARVYTNDPKKSFVILTVRALVQGIINLSSNKIRLYGNEGEAIMSAIEISAGLNKPLSLTPADFNLEGKIVYQLEEVEKGRRFRIHFKTMPSPPQSFHGFLKFKTNYPEKPIVTIWIKGKIRKKG